RPGGPQRDGASERSGGNRLRPERATGQRPRPRGTGARGAVDDPIPPIRPRRAGGREFGGSTVGLKRYLGAEGFLRALQGAYAELEAQREKINHLNVFPVPDGDTGSNMCLTLSAALKEV